MTLNERMAADVAAVFLNTAEFGDAATYNGVPVTVVTELGPDRAAGNTFTSDGQADRAVFWVRTGDVPDPATGDVIIYAGKSWRVARMLESGGGMHKLECTASEAVGW